MGVYHERDEIAVLAKRLEYLEHLDGDPRHKADLVDQLGASRSTVHRAIDELVEAGYVEQVGRGYITTQSGRASAMRYRSFLADIDAILEVQGLLDTIPLSFDIPHTVIADADVRVVDGPYEYFDVVRESLVDADHYRVVLPRVVDSRHLRLWYAHVLEEDRTVEVVTTESVIDRLREEFPTILTDLATAESFTIHAVETPPVGIVHVLDETNDGSMLVAYDGDDVAGIISANSQEMTRWIRELTEDLVDDTVLGAADLLPNTAWGDVTERGLPSQLRTEGFLNLDEIDTADALPAERGWRFGLGLPEVAAGHSLERSYDEDSTVSDTVLEQLETGAPVAVLGPAGAGKSTVCKQVASRYHEENDALVLYRPGERGETFASTGTLEHLIRQSKRPVLVVVEDVVRSGANRIFEVVQAVANRDDVSFLFDTRETEWSDPADALSDPRVDAYRREATEIVSMPALDTDEIERLLSEAEGRVDARLDVDPAELFMEVGRPDDDERSPGEMLLLGHRLATAVDSVSAGRPGMTALEADVSEVRTALESIGPVGLDVGIIANTLNAAGVRIYRELLYAVADPTSDEEFAAARAAVERLDGHVLDSRSTDVAYRGIHESWSVAFLEAVQDTLGERTARERFGRCLTSVLGLADDSERCDQLAVTVTGRTPALDRIVASPTDWADELLEAIYEVGVTNAALAPLYGTPDSSAISPPQACSTESRIQCLTLQGRMHVRNGTYERAAKTFERLESVAVDRGDRALEARARWWLGEVGQWQGAYEDAREEYEVSLEIATEIGDDPRRAASLKGLGNVSFRRGEFDQARSYYERSLELARAVSDTKLQARCRNNIGAVHERQGNLQAARESFELTLERYRELDDRQGIADILLNLGLLEEEVANYERATTLNRQSYGVYRDLGDTQGQAAVLGNLGTVALKQGRLERAEEYLEESVELAREIGERTREATSLNALGAVHRRCGALDRAVACHHEALDIAEATDSPMNRAASHRGLAQASRLSGEYEKARDLLEGAREQFEESGHTSGVAWCHLEAARLELETGEPSRALERARTARSTYASLQRHHGMARARAVIARALAETGDLDAAVRHWEGALDELEAIGVPRDELHVLERYRDALESEGSQRVTAVRARERECRDRVSPEIPSSHG